MKEIKKYDNSLLVYLKKYAPLACALLVFLLSAGFIFCKLISLKRYNERWADYDECGAL
ncbi:MAG: hypothetical protein LBL80_04605 [Ruminococcus sp.]|nr:hypothetical protein [Ruminococcus sp.]